MSNLTGSVAVVTGASRGLGHALTLALAREGAALSICARGDTELENVAAAARALGADVLPIVADLRNVRDVERVVVLTMERFGKVDVLVNNASELGPTPLPLLADYPPDVFSDVLNVNLHAPFRLTQSLIGQMLRRRQGTVINISSDVAVNGYPNWGAYSVSKAAIDGLTRTWAAELEGTGVRMYAVDPGDMNTGMHRAALPDDDPAGLTDPTDVAEALVTLINGEFTPDAVRVEASQVPPPTQTRAAGG
ncbi:MAG TPA: SDR family oxidoreductase [Candidatus Dormibacteraeota bacterium]|nr:SDR family oxidoreductase [Candidatus Dormibacteraeota bacterium]